MHIGVEQRIFIPERHPPDALSSSVASLPTAAQRAMELSARQAHSSSMATMSTAFSTALSALRAAATPR